MRRFNFLISIVCLFFLAGCQPYSFRKEINAKVIEVIDGDTIKLANGQLVRYIGIDTPETRRSQDGDWIEVNEPFAYEAKELNEKLVKGKRVRLEFDVERTDKYGRLLAYCFTNDVFVNERILEQGLGLLYTRVPNVEYVDILVLAQKKARERRNGLWAKEHYIRAREAASFIGSIATVEGKVLNVGQSKATIYLNFARDYRTDFTVVIFRKELALFMASGINLLEFKGKVIRVFGKIKEYNGPEIIISHPSQIEVIE